MFAREPLHREAPRALASSAQPPRPKPEHQTESAISVDSDLRQEDRVLLQRETGDDLWALPGGGVEAGESAETTVRRELREELGLEVRMGRPIALIENAFLLWGEWQEQIEIYFEATCEVDLTAREDARGIIRSREAHLEFALFSRGECDELDVRPAAARALLFSKHGTFAYVGRAGGSE